MSRKPTLVFIPGAWHAPSCYDILIARLPDINCRAVDLPSTKGDRNAAFKDDSDAARSVVTSSLHRGDDVVVIAHSYGGIIGASVIKGLTRFESDTTTRGCVVGFILIASGFAITGLSFMDPFLGIPPPAWKKNTASGFAEIVQDPTELFYHDVEPTEAARRVEQLQPQSLKALFEGGEHVYAGWKHVPVVYIGTTEDRGMPSWAQRMQDGMARGQGADVVHHELPTSHSPFLSRPGDVADIIKKSLKEFDRTREDISKAASRRELSLVKLWPQRWVQFGLFAGIGEMIGRFISLVGWLRGGKRRNVSADK